MFHFIAPESMHVLICFGTNQNSLWRLVKFMTGSYRSNQSLIDGCADQRVYLQRARRCLTYTLTAPTQSHPKTTKHAKTLQVLNFEMLQTINYTNRLGVHHLRTNSASNRCLLPAKNGDSTKQLEFEFLGSLTPHNSARFRDSPT